MVKSLPAMQETQFQSLVGKILWKRKWQPTPVLLPGKPHGQRSPVGYSSWGHRVGHARAAFTFISVLSCFCAHVPQAPQSLCVKLNLFSHSPPPILDEYFSHTANPQTGCRGSPLSQPPYPPHPMVCFLNFLNHLFLFIPNTTPSVCFQI